MPLLKAPPWGWWVVGVATRRLGGGGGVYTSSSSATRPAASSLRGCTHGWRQGLSRFAWCSKDLGSVLPFWQLGSWSVLRSGRVSPLPAVRRPSSQGGGTGVPLRLWKRTARRRLASPGVDGVFFLLTVLLPQDLPSSLRGVSFVLEGFDDSSGFLCFFLCLLLSLLL